MKTRATSLAFGFLFAHGCNFENQPDAPLQMLHRETFPESRTSTFPVKEGRPHEICVRPEHYPTGYYTPSDSDIESYLCGMDFGKYPNTPGSGTPVAVCPKLTGTSPGLDVMELAGQNKDRYETDNCRMGRGFPTRNYAKLKFSVTCAYTGSMLAYYHVSRILGGAGRVPVSVLRTVDAERLKTYAWRGKTYSEGTPNNQGWQDMLNVLERTDTELGRQWPSIVFTDDGKQAFGALMRYPYDYGLDDHPLLNKNTYEEFVQQDWVKKVMDARSVRELVGTDFEESVRGIYTLKDVADMVLMDYVLGQQDRMHNIESIPFYYYRDGQGMIEEKLASQVDDPATLGAVHTRTPIHRLVLRDNDCGMRATDNVFAQNDTLSQLRHMDPRTYQLFRDMAREYKSGNLRTFLLREATMSTPFLWGNDIDTVLGSGIREAEQILYRNCKSGRLQLDLDLGSHLAGRNTPEHLRSQGCGEPPSEPVFEAKCTSKPNHGQGNFNYMVTSDDRIVVKGANDAIVAQVTTRNHRGGQGTFLDQQVKIFQRGQSGTGAWLVVYQKPDGQTCLYHGNVANCIPLTCNPNP